ncbi:AbrB/MazE/SpoVT family DNA-binding domain-containing protein [Candidatus Woesearchaeota archaeon]|nr:AbrB/MazE/SpoVT family DNA-binding domain-containing protein [Candidatus Woesearchaeota archaeon]
MKRKVIQIAGSTQLVSLPRQWALRNNVKRGQEIDVQEDGSKVIIHANSEPILETAELEVSNLGSMVPRCVSALYKRGVDSLKVTYSSPSAVGVLHSALAKDTTGFEMLEQGEQFCVIKHVGGAPTEFDSVLRRIFLLLNTMSDECISAFKKENYPLLKNLAFLEEANNRFTTTCMRYLNKVGAPEGLKKVGPIYYIVEGLEQLADVYKYVCQHFSKLDKENVKLKKEVIGVFENANKLVRAYSEVYYKLDSEKIVFIKEERNKVIEEAHNLFKKNLNYAEFWLVHHSISIANQTFGMIDSLLVLRL